MGITETFTSIYGFLLVFPLAGVFNLCAPASVCLLPSSSSILLPCVSSVKPFHFTHFLILCHVPEPCL